jgi:hypothetical protein
MSNGAILSDKIMVRWNRNVHGGLLSDKIMVRWNRNVQWSDSIGQNNGAVRQKCPIEGFYRTKSCCGQAEMSDRELISDKIMLRSGRNVQ